MSDTDAYAQLRVALCGRRMHHHPARDVEYGVTSLPLCPTCGRRADLPNPYSLNVYTIRHAFMRGPSGLWHLELPA